MAKAKIEWKNHFIELIVVFLGVTIAFMLDNWRENRHNQQLEEKYLRSFGVDLHSDHVALDSVLIVQKEALDQVSRLLIKLQARQFREDSVLVLLSPVLSYEPFFPKISTFESIKNSGNLSILSDIGLQQELIRYYHLFEEKKMLEDIYFDFFNLYVTPFLMKNIDTYNHSFVRSDVIRSVEFHNLVTGVLQMLQQENSFYQELYQLNTQLIYLVKMEAD